MLAVVDYQAVPAEGAGRPAQPGPGLQQRDADARLPQRDSGGDPGQTAADHHHAAAGRGSAGPGGGQAAGRGAHAAATGPGGSTTGITPASERTATMAFSPADSDSRRCSAAAGSALMCPSSRT